MSETNQVVGDGPVKIPRPSKEQRIQSLIHHRRLTKPLDGIDSSVNAVLRYIEDTERVATDLAAIIHGDQKDKSGYPYWNHIRTVATNGMNWLERLGGLLHDICEDSDGLVMQETLFELQLPGELVIATLLINRNTSKEMRKDFEEQRAHMTVGLDSTRLNGGEWSDSDHDRARTLYITLLGGMEHPNGIFKSDFEYVMGMNYSWLARAVKLNDSRHNSDVTRWGTPSLAQLGKSHRYQSKAAYFSSQLVEDGGAITKACRALAGLAHLGARLAWNVVVSNEYLTRIEVALAEHTPITSGHHTAEQSNRAVRFCTITITAAGAWILSTNKTIVSSEFVPTQVLDWKTQRACILGVLENSRIEKWNTIQSSMAMEFEEEREFQRMNSILFL